MAAVGAKGCGPARAALGARCSLVQPPLALSLGRAGLRRERLDPCRAARRWRHGVLPHVPGHPGAAQTRPVDQPQHPRP
eukprot:4362176-Lingulodinium_polyedra.AAC.1